MSAILDPEGSQLDTGVLDDKADQRYKELKKLIHAKDAFAEGNSHEQICILRLLSHSIASVSDE